MLSNRNLTILTMSMAVIFISTIGKSHSLLLLVLPGQLSLSKIQSCGSHRVLPSPAATTKLHASQNKNDYDGDNDDSNQTFNPKSLQEKLDALLDRPFFDPDQILDNQSEEIQESPETSLNPLVWFANLVKKDYQTAEALYAAGFISIMVILAQEMLRIVRYGEAYHPFQNVGSGSLF